MNLKFSFLGRNQYKSSKNYSFSIFPYIGLSYENYSYGNHFDLGFAWLFWDCCISVEKKER